MATDERPEVATKERYAGCFAVLSVLLLAVGIFVGLRAWAFQQWPVLVVCLVLVAALAYGVRYWSGLAGESLVRQLHGDLWDPDPEETDSPRRRLPEEGDDVR